MPEQTMMPIRVLFLNTRSRWGAEVAVHLQIIRSLDPQLCLVTLATNRASLGHDRVRAALSGVQTVNVIEMNLGDEVSGKGKVGKILGTLSNLFYIGTAVIRLYPVARRCDVIHSSDRPRDALLSMLLSKLCRRPNLLHMHIKWYPGMGGLTERGMASCTTIVAISEFVKRSLIEGGLPAEKISVCYNSIDNEEFKPSEFSRDSNQAPILGIFARIMKWKGHLELFEALPAVKAAFPDFELWIVGEEDTWMNTSGQEGYADRVRRRATELGVAENLKWLGWRDNIPELMQKLDVLLAPSYEEPFGLVVAEAMSTGIPVIGWETGALPEIITDGHDGSLVPPKDADAMAESILRLLRDSTLRANMGKYGRVTVQKRFSPAVQADRMLAIYRETISASYKRDR